MPPRFKRTRSLDNMQQSLTSDEQNSSQPNSAFTQIASKKQKKSSRKTQNAFNISNNSLINCKTPAAVGVSTEVPAHVSSIDHHGPSSETLSMQLEDIFHQFSSDDHQPVILPDNNGAMNQDGSNYVDLNLRINQLTQETITQRDLINKLSSQVSFLLSFLGIQDDTLHVPPTKLSTNLPTSFVPASTAVTSEDSDANHKPSYAGVVAQPPRHLKDEMVAAVYIDMESKLRKTNNIVVTGFPSSSDVTTEKSNVDNFLQVEFSSGPFTVTNCRRLGKPAPNKIQPLLVSFSSSDQAKFFIEQAKILRKSTNLYVRDHVYINADLTRAESQAQYEIRCKRRATRSTAAAAKNVNSDTNGHLHHPQSPQPPMASTQ